MKVKMNTIAVTALLVGLSGTLQANSFDDIAQGVVNNLSEKELSNLRSLDHNSHKKHTKKKHSSHKRGNDNAPRNGTNERAYYDDGCAAGTSDAKDSMSQYYGRHSDSYDSRFKPYFKQGYEHCWSMYR